MNKIFVYFLFLVLLFNRGVAKISLGPLYVIDLWVFLVVIFNFAKTIKAAQANWPSVFMILVGSTWLIFDLNYQNLSSNDLVLRRFATAFYFLIPIVLISIGKIYVNIKFLIAALIISVFLSLFNWNMQNTVLAQVVGMFLIHAYYNESSRNTQVFTLLLLFLIVSFSVLDPQNSVYRTPIVGMLIGVGLAVVRNNWLKKYVLTRGRALVWYVVFFVISIAPLSNNIRGVSSEFLLGAYGVTNIQLLNDLSTTIAPSTPVVRRRGGASGTASTRVIFWSAIYNYNASNIKRVIVGNGHSQSFILATRPFAAFIDPQLVEPHNSFVGIYFKYGLVGLVLCFLSLYYARCQAAKVVAVMPNQGLRLATGGLALTYAFFEVVLESPHGAVIFWFIWLSPYLFSLQFNYVNSKTISGSYVMPKYS